MREFIVTLYVSDSVRSVPLALTELFSGDLQKRLDHADRHIQWGEIKTPEGKFVADNMVIDWGL